MSFKNHHVEPSGTVRDGSEPSYRPDRIGRTVRRTVHQDGSPPYPAEVNRLTEYWGVKAIAKRLGVAPSTATLWYETRGLLMFTRRRGPRFYWYTTDELLNQWLVAQCAAERKLRLEKKRALQAGDSVQ